jgi:RsiW-degrading membrane proteinase PrsW (M82 family)
MDSLGEIVSIVVTSHQNYPPETLAIRMFLVTAKLIITFAVSLILLFKSDWLVRILVGPNIDQCEKVSSRWIIAGFRMTACLCGLLILYRRMDLLPHYINAIATVVPESQSLQFSTKLSVGIIEEIIKWLIAIYLIFGAPHYVRRQMRSITVEQQI